MQSVEITIVGRCKVYSTGKKKIVLKNTHPHNISSEVTAHVLETTLQPHIHDQTGSVE